MDIYQVNDTGVKGTQYFAIAQMSSRPYYNDLPCELYFWNELDSAVNGDNPPYSRSVNLSLISTECDNERVERVLSEGPYQIGTETLNLDGSTKVGEYNPPSL